MIDRESEWYEPNLQDPIVDPRYWGLSFETHRHITHIYDTDTRALFERPQRDDIVPLDPGV
jgi:hypothetical protein